MNSYEFPIDFPRCPNCGCEETIAQLAYDKVQSKKVEPVEAFASFQKVAVPLENPTIAVLKVSVLICHQDVCAKCGLPRYTRAEIQEAPIRMGHPGQGGQGIPGGPMPFGFPPLGN